MNVFSPVVKRRPFNEMMEGLYARLSPVCASVDIWETTYLYALKGVGAIIDLNEGDQPRTVFAPARATGSYAPGRFSPTIRNARPPALHSPRAPAGDSSSIEANAEGQPP